MQKSLWLTFENGGVGEGADKCNEDDNDEVDELDNVDT